jgi:hypothetical protein
MELSKEGLEQMLAQQADRVAQESDRRMGNLQKASDEKMKEYIGNVTKESDKRMKEYMGELTKESDERMKVYIGGLKEDFDSKLETVLELVEEIPNIKAKQDMMFEKIVEVAEDVTILKETVADHALRLQRLEAR